jgi:methylmalonyl-CoA carboxyltransferase large subunit
MSDNSNPELLQSIEVLRAEIARLGERVSTLESRLTLAGPKAPSAETTVSQETVLIIAAAVAGFLGKKAPIRQIRLLGSDAWAQRGRVTIQASHKLARHG